ncbi:uncharacterized protein BO72DRAFT_167491 [Aspergillus fijiensis CBS 313.89]|uniref:Uncharacterized protein n=1 Tax=Aspergillus fijiensis CBS 313.89 TaxID=1448319 RepID=A0A8G1RRR7_9EURO|nr:uncharacterized protein BO72DRAFT_167491 [Aspergillus fijiensis CBS 313.89]RAK75531.1 hypothetical protein BO72DRAFT_167491 [Aspergillus fijiensis CBS 313.89]
MLLDETLSSGPGVICYAQFHLWPPFHIFLPLHPPPMPSMPFMPPSSIHPPIHSFRAPRIVLPDLFWLSPACPFSLLSLPNDHLVLPCLGYLPASFRSGKPCANESRVHWTCGWKSNNLEPRDRFRLWCEYTYRLCLASLSSFPSAYPANPP